MVYSYTVNDISRVHLQQQDIGVARLSRLRETTANGLWRVVAVTSSFYYWNSLNYMIAWLSSVLFFKGLKLRCHILLKRQYVSDYDVCRCLCDVEVSGNFMLSATTLPRLRNSELTRIRKSQDRVLDETVCVDSSCTVVATLIGAGISEYAESCQKYLMWMR